MEPLVEALTDAHRRLHIPSLSICVRVDGVERAHHTLGWARTEPRRAAHPDQAYDLASVTKPLAGSLVAAALAARGVLEVDAPAATWCEGLDPRITVAHLLQHTSGLTRWSGLYARVESMWGTTAAREEIMDLAAASPLDSEPGRVACYSDIGFLVLNRVLERAGGAPLDRLFGRLVLDPTGLDDLRWGWPEAAATERCPHRGAVVEGVVHDLNCAAMGGVSTHAGLFGTARSVARLAEACCDAVLGLRDDLPGAVLRDFWGRRGPGSHRLGWDGISAGYTSTGRWFPADSVGHLGYTGTSVWVVPSRRTVVVLLTNRVHPTDDLAGIREARPLIHDAVAHVLGWPATTG